MAQASPSVPQEVKYSSPGRQPSAPATTERQDSTRFFISSPMGYWALGLPNWDLSTAYISSATAAGMGVVAA